MDHVIRGTTYINIITVLKQGDGASGNTVTVNNLTKGYTGWKWSGLGSG